MGIVIKDYCTNCEGYIKLIEDVDGDFICPACKRNDCIEIRRIDGDKDRRVYK